MGLVQMPTIRHYWCRRKLFEKNILTQVMSRNRFELLLKVWHFSNNENCPENDRLYKIQPLVDALLTKYQDAYTPSKIICIDESLIPFRGRLLFKQYIPQKAHKYGIKIFKLCCDGGYTWNLKIYGGKEKTSTISVPTKIVMSLSEKLLNAGRTVVVDNFYTSLELANKLLDKKTHIVGTLRANRRGNPSEVVLKKLKRGEIVAKENNRGICVLKGKDKRDILLLSSKHIHQTITVNRHTGPVQKPKAIVDYNNGKSSVDLSDQMASYNTALRKTIKWYRKIAIELIFGTTLVNAHILYKKINDSNINITEFREQIIEKLLFGDEENYNEQGTEQSQRASSNRRNNLNTHSYKKKEGPSHTVRRYCKGCYQKKKEGLLEKNKVKKVTTYCDNCVNKPHYCIECFADYHK